MARFLVRDMTCGSCVSAITRAVQRLDPQARVEANLARHEVNITTTLDEAAVGAAISGAGFDPEQRAA